MFKAAQLVVFAITVLFTALPPLQAEAQAFRTALDTIGRFTVKKQTGGDDVLFGEGQDDDLIGGWGRDWMSGGTGDDGVLGDDGRIYTSRNVQMSNGNIGPSDPAYWSEPLFGIAKLDSVNLLISTPGDVQQAVINVSGELKKTFNLTPFNVQNPSAGAQDPLFNAK